MRSSEPSPARSTESAFNAHQRAASAPSSTERPAPSTPGMHELAVVVARELTRRARPAAVHDDRVERIVRRVRAGQHQPQLLQAFVDRAHSHLSKKAGTSVPCQR